MAADDGYITNIVHLINPLADCKQLRKVPILLFHGFNIDMASYVAVSSKQHHPEQWPRAEGQTTTSSQRSVPFALANEGHDVWLFGTRGSNAENKRYTADPEVKAKINSGDYSPLSSLESIELEDLPRSKKYWLYGLDKTISLDLERQINKVKQLTGSEEINIYTYSLSTPTLMAFLAENSDQARQVRNFIQVGPAIAEKAFSFIDRFYKQKLCPTDNRKPSFFPKESRRQSIISQAEEGPHSKYISVDMYLCDLYGTNHEFTLLERNLLTHVFKPISEKSMQRYCRQTEPSILIFLKKKAKTLGEHRDSHLPSYLVDKLDVQNWVLVSGTSDALADPTTVEKLKTFVHTPKPPVHIVIPEYNHLDLLAAVQVDEQVSRPVIKILNENSD